MFRVARHLKRDGQAGPRAATTAIKVLAAVVSAGGVGVAIGLESSLALAIALAPVGFVVGLVDWRWAVYGLLAYLPLSGIVTVAFYDADASTVQRGVPTVLKDLLFVAPAYAGFALGCWRRRRWPSLGGLPLVPIAALAALALVQSFNPQLPNRLVAVVGLKVWLFYIPLYVLGFHLVQSREALRRALAFMAVLAVLPAAVGFAEAVLFYTGRKELVYAAYGDAAANVTQGFAALEFGDGRQLLRVPSTFSFFVQYFGFLMAMLGVVWAWWRGFLVPAGRGRLGFAVIGVVVLAAFTSGSRSAYLSAPLIIAVALLLSPEERRRLRSSRPAQAAAALVASAGAVSLLALGLLQKAIYLIGLSYDSVIAGGFRQALERGHVLLGNGTGTNTPAVRYAAPELEGRVIDSWLVKTLVELGVAGLILSVVVLASVAIVGVRAHRSVSDPGLAAASAGILAVLVWVLLNTVKGFFLDVDPIAVYFWLFAGLLSGVAALDARARPAEADRAPARIADRPVVRL